MQIVPIKDFVSLFWLFINFKFHYIWYFSHSLIYKISLGQWKHYYILTNKKYFSIIKMWTDRVHIIFHASQVCEIESNLDADIETRREGTLITYIILTLVFVIPSISVEKNTKIHKHFLHWLHLHINTIKITGCRYSFKKKKKKEKVPMLGECRDVLIINVAKLSDSLRDCTHKTKPAWGRPELSWSKWLSITDECPQWLPVNKRHLWKQR